MKSLKLTSDELMSYPEPEIPITSVSGSCLSFLMLVVPALL